MSDDNAQITMTKDELRTFMQETVTDTLTKIGVQADRPIEMQKDFQHLRDVRQSTEAIKRKGVLLMFGIIFSALAGAAWVGIKTALQP